MYYYTKRAYLCLYACINREEETTEARARRESKTERERVRQRERDAMGRCGDMNDLADMDNLSCLLRGVLLGVRARLSLSTFLKREKTHLTFDSLPFFVSLDA